MAALTPATCEETDSGSSQAKPGEGPRKVFRTVPENPTPVQGRVRGVIPWWVNGRLMRNGPGIFEVGDTRYHHLFDGLALIHSFTILNGSVTYQSRYIRSETYKKNMAANRIVVSEFGTLAYPDPCQSIFQRFFSKFKALDPKNFTDNTNVNIYRVGEELVAATETDTVYTVDPSTLETSQPVKLTDNVQISMATAHAHYEECGTAHNMGSYFQGRGGPQYAIVEIPPHENGANEPLFSRAKLIAHIPARWRFSPCYFHSFGLTENYYVFVEQPLCFSLYKAFVCQFKGEPFAHALTFYPEEKVRFYVVERGSGRIIQTQYWTSSFFCFHHINAYEEDGHIVVDLSCHKDFSINKMLSVDEYFAVQEPVPDLLPSIRRYVLPINIADKDGEGNLVTLQNTSATAVQQTVGSLWCTPEILLENGFELPQINYGRHNGKKYRYAYGLRGITYAESQLVKLDTVTKEEKTWGEDTRLASEPVFVPYPSGEEEDDGVILATVVTRIVEETPFLLVLDAKTMQEMARVEFDGIDFHLDFHGLFTPLSS